MKHGLSKLRAPGCAPAGAFFQPKIHLLYFINREILFFGPSTIRHPLGGASLAGASAGPSCGAPRNYVKTVRTPTGKLSGESKEKDWPLLSFCLGGKAGFDSRKQPPKSMVNMTL